MEKNNNSNFSESFCNFNNFHNNDDNNQNQNMLNSNLMKNTLSFENTIGEAIVEEYNKDLKDVGEGIIDPIKL